MSSAGTNFSALRFRRNLHPLVSSAIESAALSCKESWNKASLHHGLPSGFPESANTKRRACIVNKASEVAVLHPCSFNLRI
jgi:hypothetical protein